jgi:hypothetical protein
MQHCSKALYLGVHMRMKGAWPMCLYPVDAFTCIRSGARLGHQASYFLHTRQGTIPQQRRKIWPAGKLPSLSSCTIKDGLWPCGFCMTHGIDTYTVLARSSTISPPESERQRVTITRTIARRLIPTEISCQSCASSEFQCKGNCMLGTKCSILP